MSTGGLQVGRIAKVSARHWITKMNSKSPRASFTNKTGGSAQRLPLPPAGSLPSPCGKVGLGTGHRIVSLGSHLQSQADDGQVSTIDRPAETWAAGLTR